MKNVIIIGAGPAGLTAADKLLDEKQCNIVGGNSRYWWDIEDCKL